MPVLDDFQCINCEFTDEYFRKVDEPDATRVCPNCGKEMHRVLNAPAINDSKSLTFAHISPERKHDIRTLLAKSKAKQTRNKDKKQDATNLANDMSRHTT